MGNRIRELRRSMGITMKQLGKELGVAESTISHYETGRRQLDNETLLRLGEFFGVTVGYLIGAEEDKKAPADAGKRSVSDDDIKFALFGGDGEITDEMYDEVKRFAAYIKQREGDKK